MLSQDQLVASNGNKITRGLFVEVNQYDKMKPIFSLSDNKKEGFISLKELFLKFVPDDPSEATFALAVFGSISHWEEIKATYWFKPYYERWTLETDILRKSEAFKSVISEVKNNGKSAFSAAKFLIDEPWKPKTKVSREKKKESTGKAYDSVSADVIRLKDQGLL